MYNNVQATTINKGNEIGVFNREISESTLEINWSHALVYNDHGLESRSPLVNIRQINRGVSII